MRKFEKIKCEKVFCSSIAHFETVINLPQLVQEMQGNPRVVSIFDTLGYSIEPKFNTENSLNFLKSMLLLFTKDVKERFKDRIKKIEKDLL